MTVLGGLLPILQGWIFFVLALYLFATEFDTGQSVEAPAAAGPPVRAGSPPPATIARGAPRVFVKSTSSPTPLKSPE